MYYIPTKKTEKFNPRIFHNYGIISFMSVIIPVLPKEILHSIFSLLIDKRASYVVLNKKMTQREFWWLLLDVSNYPELSEISLKWIKKTIYDPPERFSNPQPIYEIISTWESEMNFLELLITDKNLRKACERFVSEECRFYFATLHHGFANRNGTLYFSLNGELLKMELLNLIEAILCSSWDYTPCIFYNDISKKSLEQPKTNEIAAYKYCFGHISFEKAVKEYYN
jgi:hypothetical protein